MTIALMLAVPGFTKSFELETDAFDKGIGAESTNCYLTKALSTKHQLLSIYEKEMITIIIAASEWRHYLEGISFIICTDQKSIKHMLEQRLKTFIQQNEVFKLLGLTYTIQYKKGRDNSIANALSRWETPDEGEARSLANMVIPSWVNKCRTLTKIMKKQVNFLLNYPQTLRVNPYILLSMEW